MGNNFIGETLEIGLDVALKTMDILIHRLLLLADGNGGHILFRNLCLAWLDAIINQFLK